MVYTKFDAMAPTWDESPAVNVMTLIATENHFDILLEKRGYVFLRDVYESLGLPVTKHSCVTGWSKKMDEQSHVKFDIKPIKMKGIDTGEFRLGFNIDGTILNFIED